MLVYANIKHPFYDILVFSRLLSSGIVTYDAIGHFRVTVFPDRFVILHTSY